MWNYILLSEAQWRTPFTMAVYMHINIIFKYATTHYFAYCSLNKGGRFLSRHTFHIYLHCMYISICIYIYMYIYIYANIYIYTRIYKFTHTYHQIYKHNIYSLVWKKNEKGYMYWHIIFSHTQSHDFLVCVSVHIHTRIQKHIPSSEWRRRIPSTLAQWPRANSILCG